MLKSKIHRASLTGTDLSYEGSIAVDACLLEAADILPNEQVHVLNINNGQRLVTYAIEAERNSGEVRLNGAAARCGTAGDLVIIITYTDIHDSELKQPAHYQPKIVKVDEQNKIRD